LYVISDLHLGGAPSIGPGTDFQMCSPLGQARLAEFIRFVKEQSGPGRRVELVINGDFVDFLAEQPFSAFTLSDEMARTKLAQAIGHTQGVWDQLAAFVKGGGCLTLLLGNHDLELSLPGPRRELLDRLGGGGQVEFIYDNQALRIGPILIEHGNRYDGWNAVDHASLREMRSLASRQRPTDRPGNFTAPKGSQLVIDVMNEIKSQYSFIDLLKPENEAAIPLLGVLAPGYLHKLELLVDLYKKRHRASAVKFDEQGEPALRDYISAEPGRLVENDSMGAFFSQQAAQPSDAEQEPAELAQTVEALRLTEELLGKLSQGRDEISARGWFNQARGLLEVVRGGQADERRKQIEHLRQALRFFGRNEPRFLFTDWEQPEYRKPAESAADRGFKYVVYGHTHLLRNLPLHFGAHYFNTGTWADLIFLPKEVFDGDETAAHTRLESFVHDLAEGNLSRWRGPLPSYAYFELGDGGSCQGWLRIFDSARQQRSVEPGQAIWRLHGRG